MSELHQRLADASEQLVSRWSPERAEAAWRGVQQHRGRAARQRIAGAAALVLTVLAVLLMWPEQASKRASVAVPVPSAKPDSPLLVLDDGSQVIGLTEDTRITELERSPTTTRLRLEQGAARFRVTRRPDRVFSVLAADARATVLGTIFTVRLEPDSVLLEVERGRVRLQWPKGDVVVGAGEQHRVPRRHAAMSEESRPPPAPSAELAPTATRRPPRPPSWREFAERGEYDAAYDRLSAAGPGVVRNEPGDLLLAADVTRLGGHPAESVTWLQRVVEGHAGDSRAALAAFTLGRVYLDQLGRPHQAAEAFARARQMAPGGALAEDALAREVESRARCGDTAAAHRLAEQYLKRYPGGRRAASVRRHGGLEAANP